jgi:peptidoglycan-N-acetylglucosamine deacetylase
MYLVRTPELIKPLFRDLLWDLRDDSKDVYLTFDDGPIPEVTPWVLDRLAEFHAKATFFCLGRNARRSPAILDRIRQEGHSIGNHTWDHPNGWDTPLFTYLRNVQRCQEVTGTKLFRPPYGRITWEQSRVLATRYTIVMWEVLSADFDQQLDGQSCARNVIDHASPGSIIVFHDSLKAWDRLSVALPAVLRHLCDRGLAMKPIPEG